MTNQQFADMFASCMDEGLITIVANNESIYTGVNDIEATVSVSVRVRTSADEEYKEFTV